VRKAADLAAFAFALCAFAGAASAQVLYKWTDADGKTQYSDRPPKNFTGVVTRMEPDVQPPPGSPYKAPDKAPASGSDKTREAPAVPPDRATQRRTTRDALEKRVADARANLEKARKALESGENPEPEEQQVVQQQQKPGQGGMHGLSQQRSTCRPSMDVKGKAIVLCNATMPNEQYFERQVNLEEAVKQAEEELAAAQEAWRRGMD
jgi:hypothetical protein